MRSSKRRLLQAYSRIADENLRALVAQLVQIYSEHAGSSTPRARYKATIDAFASKYGNDLSTDFLDLTTAPDEPREKEQEKRRSGGIITLQTLTLCNFGSYRNETHFNLEPKGDRNVTVVVGSSGDGKSTLFFALNWALYGDDYLAELESDKGRTLASLVNRGALKAAEDSGTSVSVSVKLDFQVRGNDYYIIREATAEPAGKELPRVQQSQTRLRKIEPNGNHTDLLPGAQAIVLAGLPKHVRDFYLFDGEQINRFVTPGSQLHIKRALKRVMGIEALEATAKGLAGVSTELRREVASKSTGQLETVARQLEAAHTELAATRDVVEKKRDELSLLASTIAKLDHLLSSAPDTKPLHDQRVQLERQIANYREDQARLNYEIRELAADTSLVLAGEAVSQLVRDLDVKRQAGVIPGPINRQLLKDLLELGKCICGSDITEGTHTRAHIESTLAELRQKAETGEASLALFFELSALDGRLQERAVSLDKKRRELDRLYERRRIDQERLNELQATLAGMVEVDRAGWERERSEKRDQDRKAASEKAIAEAKIAELQARIRSLQEEEGRIVAGNAQAAQLTINRNWAEAAEAALIHVHDEFAAAARVDVETSTAQLWNHLIPNVKLYKVVVSQDFELKVFDPTGRPAMHDLSMGQQQCLGLAFITAVAQVAESRPPLVIDMPFGRLGVDVASSVARKLPELTEQLVLFVLPETEWNSQTSSAIEPHLAREYLIQYDADAQSTEIGQRGIDR